VHVYLCMYVYTSKYACAYVCMNACMYLCMHYVCMYVYKYVCIYRGGFCPSSGGFVQGVFVRGGCTFPVIYTHKIQLASTSRLSWMSLYSTTLFILLCCKKIIPKATPCGTYKAYTAIFPCGLHTPNFIHSFVLRIYIALFKRPTQRRSQPNHSDRFE